MKQMRTALFGVMVGDRTNSFEFVNDRFVLDVPLDMSKCKSSKITLWSPEAR